MKKILFIAAIVVGAMICTGCQTREQRAINRLEKLSEKIKKDGAKWDADQWADAYEEIYDIHADLEDCEFNKEQLRKLGEMEGRLMGVIAVEVSKKLETEVNSFLEDAGSFLKGFGQGIHQTYDIEDVESSFESIGKELENLARELDD